jgi:AraC-like DNA-binding protein
MSVESGERLWVVPFTDALWLPARTGSAVSLSSAGALSRVYVRGAPSKRVTGGVHAIHLSPLLKELLRRVMELGQLHQHRVRERRLIDVIVDELTATRTVSVNLPMPRDSRARAAADYVRENIKRARVAAAVARHSGASVRTLERLFLAETGLSFGVWRQRARLMQSTVLLAEGASVTRVALATGYASASAYVTAFKSLMGATPGQYALAARRRSASLFTSP